MIQQNSKKIVSYLIICLFLLTTLAPVLQSRVVCNADPTTSQHISNQPEQNINDQPRSLIRPDGLSPKTPTVHKTSPEHNILLDRGYFYAYNAYDPSGAHDMGPITFDTPDAIDLLAPGIFPNFCGGADMDNEGNWYGCDYAGGLYHIDMNTGSQTFVGASLGVNGMTYDGTTLTWYVTASNNLYIMDVNSGSTTIVGSHGGVTNTIIGIACDIDGNMYGYDALWTGDSTLYSIDKITGAATAIGPMGYGFVYAQDMNFDRDNDILYISGYFNDGTPSALLTCDDTTGQCTIVGSFEGGMEVDGDAIPWTGLQYDHDIGITGIIKPDSGNVGLVTPIVKVKNAGLFTETNIPVHLSIGKELITGIVENFEANNGSYTHAPKLPQPDAWAWGAPTSGPMAAHSGFNVWATNLAGVYPPSMWCYLLTAPFIVPSGAMFNFWHWYYFENNYDGGNIKISNDGGVTWTLITPVGSYPGAMPYNPFMTGQPAYNGQSGGWKQANFDLSAYEGQLVQVMFETASDSSVQYTGWYIDDVGFTITSWVNEYTQTAYVSTIAPEEVAELPFPTWTPGDLGLVENVNINYNAEATALLVGDQNINNDYKEKVFNLHYGFFHDVAVTEIISPASGIAATQTPEVVIENHGQNAESVNVQMTIGKANYTTLIQENFAGGVPPAGWGTNYPDNWYSSSTNYAGGTSPEAQFSWTPSSVGEHLLYTGIINTTGYTALLLKFKEFVNDYNSDYLLKVVTSTDGGATWNDAYMRTGGPYGPTTTEVTLTETNGIGSATFQIAWDFSGDSFNINYWYIDDVWMGIIDMVDEYNQTVSVDINPGEILNVLLPDWTPADIPFATTIDYLINTYVSMNTSDGNPADNHQSKLITLQYEHDMGVYGITEPDGPYREDIIWDNYADDGFGTGLSSQLDVEYPFNSQCVDDFQFTEAKDVTGAHWWGVFWNGVPGAYPNPCEFNVIFYADDGSGTMPTGAGLDDPTSTALAVYNFPAVTGVSYGTDKYEYDVTFDPPFVAESDMKFWIAIQAVFPYSGNGQWGFATNEANPDQLSSPVQGFPVLGIDYWTQTSYDDQAFQLSGHIHYMEYWPPGIYSIEGLIKNFGAIYSETDIPVNTKIIFLETGETIYNENIILPGPVEPGDVVLASFPNVTFPNEYEWDGMYKLEMKTMLPDDDHPANDKKSLTFYIYYIYYPPPTTTATVMGTMGDNDWYISCVTVTLTATDGKWPHGVNHTYYKIDDGDWNEYFEPFTICDDGQHTVYFYSVDKAIPPNVEEEKSISFKIDKTAPIIISYSAMSQNPLMTEWLLELIAEDPTSGIVLIEFFADDMLVGNVTAEPYQLLVEGKIQTTQCIVYDSAGNSQESDIINSYEYDSLVQYFYHLQVIPQKPASKIQSLLFDNP